MGDNVKCITSATKTGKQSIQTYLVGNLSTELADHDHLCRPKHELLLQSPPFDLEDYQELLLGPQNNQEEKKSAAQLLRELSKSK
jgi:hypothetical protein